MALYTIPERVHIKGWDSSSHQARFRLRNGGASAIGPLSVAGPRTPRFEVDGPRRIASLAPGEVVAFTVRFLPSNNGKNAQDACVFSVAGEPHCFVRLQASREEAEGQQVTFYPPECDILPAVLRTPATPAATTSTLTSADQDRPRSGRASRAVTEAMKARSGDGGAPMVMLHPDRNDLFYMEGVWYDSRGLEWDPKQDLAVDPGAQPESELVPAEEQCGKHATRLGRQDRAHPELSTEATAAGIPPPDWVMSLLDGAPAGERTQQIQQSADQGAGGSVDKPREKCKASSKVAEDEDGDDDDDEFVRLLERELSTSQASSKPRQRSAGQWKHSSGGRVAGNGDADEEDGEFAEQLAQQLQRSSTAPKTHAAMGSPRASGKPRQPTAAEKRAQDAKWMACS